MLFRQNLLLASMTTGILLLFVTSVSVAQSTEASSRLTSEIQHFAIMGEVVQPGVYELKSSSPFLSNLVRISGGLTKKATGHLRIIRQGRSGQQAYFTPSVNITLQPGDVVVADSKNRREPKHKTVKFSDQPNTNAKRPEQEYVQLGFINLIKRPVVVKIRKELATLPQIIKSLGQPAEAIKNVRVVSSSRQRGETGILSNCSLLIFERPVPSPDRIPALPATWNEQQLAQASPINIGEPASPKIVLDQKQENRPSQPNSAEAVLLIGPALLQSDGSTQPEKDDASRVVMLPAPGSVDGVVSAPGGDSHLIAESDLLPQPTVVPAPPVEVGPTMLVEKSGLNELDSIASSMNEGDFSSVDVPVQASTSNSSSSNAVTYALGLLLIVGGGVFVWAVAPRKIGVTVPQQVEAKSVAQSLNLPAAEVVAEADETGILEAIINDELPIVAEQVILPVSLELYGHSTGHEKLRIDAAHKMAEPHFKPGIPQPIVQDEVSQKASAIVAPGMRIDPAINLEGSIEATRSPLVSPATFRSKKTH